MRFRKRFGQHFLEAPWVAKLVDGIAPAPTDWFLEIGPGRGAITVPLARVAARIVAVEIDRELAAALQRVVPPNVNVITGNVLDLDVRVLVQRELAPATPDAEAKIRVVGNLPYNISSPILFRLLEASAGGLLHDATLMLQEEVADRLVATPGTREYGVLTLLTELDASVTRILSLPPGAFRPPPKVRSSVVRLTFRPPRIAVRNRALLVDMIRKVFTQRRKTIANALTPFADSRKVAARAALEAAGIDPVRRPETLELQEFARLADEFDRLIT